MLSIGGCGSSRYVTVRVPPQVDLTSYEVVGVIGFKSNADASIDQYATQRLQSTIQSAQLGTRLLELGIEESVLAAIGASQLDADAIKRIGTKFGVAALFHGHITYSEPNMKIGGVTDPSIAQGSVRADMRGEMFVKLLETKTSASIWSNSSWATKQIGGVSVSSAGEVSGAMRSSNPRQEMVPTLVSEVVTGLRETTARRRVE